MGITLQQFRVDLQQPWQRALVLIALVPLFPEYISFFLVIAAAFFAYKDLRQNPRHIRIDLIGKLLLGYSCYMTLTCLYSSQPLHSLAIAAMWLFFFAVYLIVTNMLTDADRFDGFLLCITAVAGAVGIIACIQYRLNFFLDGNTGSLWGWLDKIVFDLVPFEITQLHYALRAYSTFPNPNMLAQYLVMVAPFVACFNFCERRHDLRYFSRICLFLTFAGIMFSFSRGGYVALLLLCVGLILLNIRHKFATVSLYVVSALLFLPEEVVNRLLTIRRGVSSSGTIANNAVNSIAPDINSAIIPEINTTTDIINSAGAEIAVSERWRIWLESIGSIWERPLFGYGAGTETTWTLFEEANINAVHAHNIVLQILLEGGIVALIIMALIGFKVVKNSVELMRDGYNNSFWIGFATLSFAICFLVHGIVDYPLATPRMVCIFITLLSLCERSVHLYVGRGINVRKHIRARLKQRRNPAQ